MTSRLGTGKWQTFFYSVSTYCIIDVYLVPEWEGGEGGEVLGPPHRHEEEPGRRLVDCLLTKNSQLIMEGKITYLFYSAVFKKNNLIVPYQGEFGL